MYHIDTDPQASKQIDALPAEALESYSEILCVLQVVPWNGAPYVKSKPDGVMRQWVFGPHGEGLVLYMILEDQQRVDVLEIFWLA
ncbi:hypothetical protein ALI144C_46180 [Actinosynnema sp. ALI-1.44]|uniref:hypothetical protein n=1 Tax=Actinosynnema sp. ALI-1.44 TaxID=1933779 RepID=UPI00097C5EC0|nr:hypothetical protein [Actinosynnema sp. ALI-1.44]ONI73303.1 hypothetical protein ALI144C_46180 [Actinosynnema sp. ALI-1.44]